MSILEKLANIPIPWVIGIVIVLFVIRYVMLKQRTPMAKSIAELAESLGVAMGLVFLIIRPFIIQAFFIPSDSMVPTLLKDDRLIVNKFIYRFKEPKLGDIVVFKAPPEAATDGIEKDYIKRVIGVPGDEVRVAQGYVKVGDNVYDHNDLRENLGVYVSGNTDEIRVKLANGRVLLNGQVISNAEIARAFGKPSAKVKVVPGLVYINGKPLNEPYTAEDSGESYPNIYSEYIKESWIKQDKNGNDVVKIPKGRLLVMGDNRNNSSDARAWGLLDRKRLLGKAMFIFWPLSRVRLLH